MVGQDQVIFKMTSIGTALGIRSALVQIPEYASYGFTFLEDPCAGPLAELGERWDKEYTRFTRLRCGHLGSSL
jgi:hypothetical protein